MRVYDLIKRKREGGTLTGDEIRFIIDGTVKGKIPDYQISALLMAIFFQGMSSLESWELTRAMMSSGSVLDLSLISAPKIDKHSTGGVGDKVSLVLAPLAAAAGICVPMMSGRGLGHTGGTLDKLAAIKGLRVDLSGDELSNQLREINLVMIGQTQDLVPADRKLYALRDVTATVDCIPLIASSIMSKKLAEGIQGLVLDIKVGSGAFMKERSRAIRLAREMVAIGQRAGCEVVALITDMDQPLGRAVGNALEVREAVEVLRGGGPGDVRRLSVELGAWMMKMGGLDRDLRSAGRRLKSLIEDHTAYRKFREMVVRQGGDPGVIDHPERLPSARHQAQVAASRTGYVSRIRTEVVGTVAMHLGAGRDRVEATINPAVGITVQKKRGDRVERGEALAFIHYDHPQDLPLLTSMLREAYVLSHRRPRPHPLVQGIVTRQGVKVIRDCSG